MEEGSDTSERGGVCVCVSVTICGVAQEWVMEGEAHPNFCRGKRRTTQKTPFFLL